MNMSIRQRLLASSLLFGAAIFSAPAYAQDNDDQDASPLPEASESSSSDTIVVTGSRIRRDEFNSPTPIQVLEAEEARRIGITNVQDLLQRTTVASGTQIDATLNTASGTSNGTEAPPSGGTGSSNIDLRGLGIERSLVLVNGRRLGSAGVRGAPAQPDISLLPLGLIERVDVVTEGASSIYGADAVAGVVNVILRTDFEGLEITGGIQRPEHGGGDIETVSLVAGASSDRARIMLGVDYYRRQLITAGQRDFSRESRRILIGEDGQRYVVTQNGLFDNIVYDISGTLSGAPGYADVFPLLFYTPGSTNIGVDNFSDYRALPPVPAGVLDQCTRAPLLGRCYGNFVNFDQYNEQDELRAQPLVQPLQRYSFVATGSYDLFPEHNVQAYLEAYYFNRQQEFSGLQEQIFPDVPGVIPVVDANGFATRDGAGNVITTDNPFNPFDGDVEPILSITDAPQRFTIELQQTRLVGGIRGDIPGSWFEDRNWSFDVYWSYDRATGFQSQPIILEEHLYNATQGVYAIDDGAGGFTYGCGPIDRIGGGFLSLPDCVPVNLFAPSIYATGGGGDDGSFSSQAERDYLIGNRTNRTVVQQTVYSATVTGDLFTLPWANGGMVAFAAGYEHRDDSVSSQNDIVGAQGLNAAENPSQEGETIGRRSLNEVYAELSLPLLSRVPFAYELTIDGALRYTEESNFGDDLTYRARALWRPISWIQLSGSYGTSYRAPNLREQFLAPQAGGIGGQNDPCVQVNVQAAITAAAGGDGDPAVVNRINNCIASGIAFTDTDGNGRPDSTVLGTTGVTTIPVFNGGNADLEPETSRSYTATLAISPPISSAVQLNMSASYYDIRVESSVNELDAATIINRCYLDEAFPNLSSPFCSQIDRPTTGNPTSRIISEVRSGFVNTGFETVKGVDFNLRARFNLEDLTGWQRSRLTMAGTVSYVLEHDFQVLPDQPIQDLRGTFGYPNWKFQPTVGLEVGPWTLVAQGRFIGPQHRLVRTVFAASTILAGSPRVRALDYVGAIYYQDLSLTYEADRYSITAGVSNLFDREPNLIDGGLAFQRNNAYTGSGYDFVGRSFFINGTLRF